VQTADRVTGTVDGTETIDFRFGLANEARSMQAQLNDVNTVDIDIFDFNPGAVNQAVEFDTLYGGRAKIIADNVLGVPANSITGLDSIFTSGGNDLMLNIEAAANQVNAVGTLELTATKLFIESAAGNDTITAEGAELTGDIGNDASLTVVAGDGDDSVVGFNGLNAADSLLGNDGNDTLVGLAGNDIIDGGADDDSVAAGSGDDNVLGGTGNDTIDGSFGDDTIDAGDGNDAVLGAAGDDSIQAGLGNDFVNGGNGGANPSGNDTINGDAGNDSILSGDGIDSILGGSNDDLIGFGDAFNSAVITNAFVKQQSIDTVDADFDGEDGVFNSDDRVDGGEGLDTVAISMGDLIVGGQTINLNSDFFQNVEQLNVNTQVIGFNNRLIVDTSAISDTTDRLTVITTSDTNPENGSLQFNSTSLVQGQSIEFFDSAQVDNNERTFGSGDDIYANDFVNPSEGVTVAGNGGSDVIKLSATTTQVAQRDALIAVDPTLDPFVATAEFVRFTDGNDGGDGGASTGGDLISNFDNFAKDAPNLARDLVLIGNDGDLPPALPGTKASNLLFGLTERQGSFERAATLIAVENEVLTLGGQTAANAANTASTVGLANNMLFLTGPERSITDEELTSAAVIAAKISNNGVEGNGLSFGDPLGDPTDPATQTIQQQSSQALIVQQGQTGTALWLYIESSFNFDVAQNYTVEASELRQLAIFEDALLDNRDFQTTSGIDVFLT
jgi:hypothetical protein